MKERTVFVYADWSADGPQLIGRLYRRQPGKEIFSFDCGKNRDKKRVKSALLCVEKRGKKCVY